MHDDVRDLGQRNVGHSLRRRSLGGWRTVY
jgi:hypothetical protein